MKLTIFAVRDSKTETFGNPMFLVTEGQAIRSFGDEVQRQDENNPLNKHPEDFSLFKLGTYDTDTGEFDTHRPTGIAVATQFKPAK